MTLDVREELRRGGEPLPRIMETVKKLRPGEKLRLLATFEPIPLFHVMAARGFRHEAKQVAPGDWEVLFIPDDGAASGSAAARAREGGPAAKGGPASTSGPAAPPVAEAEDWPDPARSLDNRGLMPPEPMIRVLEALETLPAGEVLEVRNDREPVFLYPELAERGCEVRTEKLEDGVRLLIRKGGSA